MDGKGGRVMETFVLWMAVLILFEILGNVIALAKEEYPPRTPATCGVNVVFNLGLLLWAVSVLLVR